MQNKSEFELEEDIESIEERNTKNKWTVEEIELAQAMRKAQKPIVEIARALGRGYRTVQDKITWIERPIKASAVSIYGPNPNGRLQRAKDKFGERLQYDRRNGYILDGHFITVQALIRRAGEMNMKRPVLGPSWNGGV